MTSKEALEEIKDWVEYFTRLDYVEPIVRDEVKQKFKDAYWGTLNHFEIIEKDLEVLAMLKHTLKIKKSNLYGFEIIVHGSDEEENKIKEWVEND